MSDITWPLVWIGVASGFLAGFELRGWLHRAETRVIRRVLERAAKESK